eukprot:TRINITY_DN2267_c0_g1_i2.p1 TRINITY_DN2267_c0_g1~~TRINITY_DN2267_c0_g1_i2.p1  ORF type:complete len:294 (-),score=45.92 TRINITY_DN2267_c0_g1_i2:72-911(-)
MATIFDIPDDVLGLVLQHLPIRSIATASLVNHTWCNVLEAQDYWQNRFCALFGVPSTEPESWRELFKRTCRVYGEHWSDVHYDASYTFSETADGGITVSKKQFGVCNIKLLNVDNRSIFTFCMKGGDSDWAFRYVLEKITSFEVIEKCGAILQQPASDIVRPISQVEDMLKVAETTPSIFDDCKILLLHVYRVHDGSWFRGYFDQGATFDGFSQFDDSFYTLPVENLCVSEHMFEGISSKKTAMPPKLPGGATRRARAKARSKRVLKRSSSEEAEAEES